MIRSRIPVIGMTERYTVVRLLDVKQGGRIKKQCQELILYEQVPGRPENLRKLSENRDAQELYGQASSRVRKFKIAPQNPPLKLAREDYLKIPWGQKPNLQIPSTVPDWAAPAVCLSTPDGLVTLTWVPDGLTFTDGAYTLGYDGDTWYLDAVDEPRYEFDLTLEQSPLCRPFPDGFRFVKQTGPSILYQIVDYSHNTDDVRGYSHTSLECELRDQDGVEAQ